MPEDDKVQLRQGVHDAYSKVALQPNGEHPFPTGSDFAAQIGYPSDFLDIIPQNAIQSFAGVSNVSIFADIPTGASVLDLGCGTGLDSHIAAQKVTNEGRVIGVDFSQAMLNQAQSATHESNTSNLSFVQAGGEKLPLADQTIDIALINGIFNLNPMRDMIFQELARVLRRGGLVFAAEIILSEPLADDERSQANWFA
ncbi:MAG: methyltransferase domain-containing protein [Anaerolineae bacterium]|nr:methyltransferase domain-containing protein [Anaerolineae bacterium]MDQ7033574.1 methyltransferase domain-containing protein [Anaerolineae bacterium]